MHEGDHVNAVRYCFNQGSFMYSGLCMCDVCTERRRKKTKQNTKTQKTQKTNTFQVQSAKCAHPSAVDKKRAKDVSHARSRVQKICPNGQQ